MFPTNGENSKLSNPVEALSPFPSETDDAARHPREGVMRTAPAPASDTDDPIVFESVPPCPLPIVAPSLEAHPQTSSPLVLRLEESLAVWQRRLSAISWPFAFGVLCGIVVVSALRSEDPATGIAPGPQLSQNAIVPAAFRDVAIPEAIGHTAPPAESSSAPAVERPKPAPPLTPQRSRAQHPVTATRFRGHLIIDSEPRGASVMINQRLVGITPLELSRFPASSYAVRVQQDGYERWSAGVLVPADKVTRVHARLQKIQ